VRQRHDLERIKELKYSFDEAESALKKAVRQARADGCLHWMIGEQLGISEGSVVQRFTRGYYDN